MALDKAFFDSINIDVAKKKYYNVNKVEAVLQSIRCEAEALNEENARLRQEVERMNREKVSVGDAIISARELARQIISEANAEADEKLRLANARAEEILREAREQCGRITSENSEPENYAAQFVLDTIEKLKERQLEAVKQLNDDYQRFLCGLYPDAETRAFEPIPDKTPAVAAAVPVGEQEDDEEEEEETFALESLETVPDDLREKVSAIAKVLRTLDRD